jgi:hypothetical protein
MIICDLSGNLPLDSVYVNDLWSQTGPDAFKKVLFDSNSKKIGTVSASIGFEENELFTPAVQASLENYVVLGKVNPYIMSCFLDKFSNINKPAAPKNLNEFFRQISANGSSFSFNERAANFGGTITNFMHISLFDNQSLFKAFETLGRNDVQSIYDYTNLICLTRNYLFSIVWELAKKDTAVGILRTQQDMEITYPTNAIDIITVPEFLHAEDIKIVHNVVLKIASLYNDVSMLLGRKSFEKVELKNSLPSFADVLSDELKVGFDFLRGERKMPQKPIYLRENLIEATCEDRKAQGRNMTHKAQIPYKGGAYELFSQRGNVVKLKNQQSYYINKTGKCPFRSHVLRKINITDPNAPDYINPEAVQFKTISTET